MKSNEQLRTESLILINAIITQPDDLDFRMHLRNEFMRVGLLDVLDVSFGITRYLGKLCAMRAVKSAQWFQFFRQQVGDPSSPYRYSVEGNLVLPCCQLQKQPMR